jgi:hypothetical protein
MPEVRIHARGAYQSHGPCVMSATKSCYPKAFGVQKLCERRMANRKECKHQARYQHLLCSLSMYKYSYFKSSRSDLYKAMHQCLQ